MDTITWHYEDKNSESDYIISNVTNHCVNGSLTYDTYDNVGNILTRKENGQAVLDKYQYDNIYQLWKTWYCYNPSTQGFNLNVTFNFDALGNRDTVQYGADTETYGFVPGNKLNQYNSVQYNGGAAQQILYDANPPSVGAGGNMTQLGNKAFTYDARNRMIPATVSATSAVYQYDSINRRISKTVDSSTIKYCYDGDQIIAEYDPGGSNPWSSRYRVACVTAALHERCLPSWRTWPRKDHNVNPVFHRSFSPVPKRASFSMNRCLTRSADRMPPNGSERSEKES